MGWINKPETTTSSNMIWNGRPSMMLLFPYMMICAVLGLALPLFWLLIPWMILKVLCTRFELYDDKLIIKFGILCRVRENVELYRIKDVQVVKPIFMRLLGLGHVVVVCSDATTGREFPIEAVRDSDDLGAVLRDLVENVRMAKGVRELDIGQVGGMI